MNFEDHRVLLPRFEAWRRHQPGIDGTAIRRRNRNLADRGHRLGSNPGAVKIGQALGAASARHPQAGRFAGAARCVGQLATGRDIKRAAGIGPVEMRARSRSEEHTSELQSLMRISYAVFCLKKKNKEHIIKLKQQLYKNKKIEY